MGIIKAWSPSRLRDYEQCPLLAKYKYIDQLCTLCFKGRAKGWPIPTCDTCKKSPNESPALKNGGEVHKSAENFVKGIDAKLDDRLKPVKKIVMEVRAAYKKKQVAIEKEIALDKYWKPVEYFAPSVYVRLKLDVLWTVKGLMRVIDWKTGKYKPDAPEYAGQLEMYQVGVLSAGLGDSADAQLVFTEHNEVVPSKVMKRGDLEPLQKKWDKRALPLISDETFAPAPSNSCRWCDYSNAKGGPCEY